MWCINFCRKKIKIINDTIIFCLFILLNYYYYYYYFLVLLDESTKFYFMLKNINSIIKMNQFVCKHFAILNRNNEIPFHFFLRFFIQSEKKKKYKFLQIYSTFHLHLHPLHVCLFGGYGKFVVY